MNSKFLLAIGFCFLFIATSCSKGGNIENAADKQTYITQIEKLSDTDRKQQLERDADMLQQTLDSISELTMYFSFSFGLSGSSSSDIDTAQVFTIASQADYLKDFSLVKNSEVTTSQKFTEGEADFKFYTINSGFSVIDRSDLKYAINGVYKDGKRSDKNGKFLSVVDSLDVTVSYTYPLAFDTITINSKADSILYNGQTIAIESSEENTLELEYPIGLNVLGYKAINADGLLMDKTGSSSFPITGFSPMVAEQIKKTIALLRQAAQAENKDQSLAYLKEIPDDTFTKISMMVALEKEYNDIEKNKDLDTNALIDYIKSLMKRYTPLFALTKQTLELTFPMPYQQVYLYVATKTDTVSSDVKVIPTNEGIFAYNVFTDSTQTKYGVVDNKGNIIIPATYSDMIQYDTLYFNVKEEDKEVGKYLNTQTLKFETLPTDARFRSQLTSDLSVFSDKENYYGVLKDNKTEVIPFKYDAIFKIGKTIVAQASKRGRPYYLFYTLDGKQIDIDLIKEINIDEEAGDIIIRSADRKYGYIDNQGTLAIAPKYSYMERLGNNLFSFATDDKDMKLGILDNKGKIIKERIFDYVESFYDNRAIVSISTNNNTLSGYINEKGEIAIEPKYDGAYDFYNGYALVFINSIFYLIDKEGNTVKKFDESYVDSYKDEDSDEKNPVYIYQTNDSKKYNYKGEPIK